MSKKQEYIDLRNRQMKEIEEFPIAYAFSETQLVEALKKLGATREECVSYLGVGDILRKADVPKYEEMWKRQRFELREAMKDEEFAEAAFLYEMDNHEYAINWEGDSEVLSALCLNETLLKKYGLESAYQRARNRHMNHAMESGIT